MFSEHGSFVCDLSMALSDCAVSKGSLHLTHSFFVPSLPSRFAKCLSSGFCPPKQKSTALRCGLFVLAHTYKIDPCRKQMREKEKIRTLACTDFFALNVIKGA